MLMHHSTGLQNLYKMPLVSHAGEALLLLNQQRFEVDEYTTISMHIATHSGLCMVALGSLLFHVL